jgi:3'-phosphoadenosine 5'-phosphosulfate sulfotransferase (PAPS reductase)/FAD synthetase
MSNPYYLNEPAIISFSGGATSGFMLHQVWLAHGKKIPSHVKVAFANTGLEHPKTLDFVERCSLEWDIEVNWLEYNCSNGFTVVNYSNASRNGEPFSQLIEKRQYLPNVVARFCTVELKIKTIERWAASLDGFAPDGHMELLGLRYDEPRRVSNIKKHNRKNEAYCPMYDAKHTIEHVDSFWGQQPFKLEIPRLLGNCVGCFLKGASKINSIACDFPELIEWWAKTEEEGLGNGKTPRFRSDRPSYRGMINMARDQNMFVFPDDECVPCNCTD